MRGRFDALDIDFAQPLGVLQNKGELALEELPFPRRLRSSRASRAT